MLKYLGSALVLVSLVSCSSTSSHLDGHREDNTFLPAWTSQPARTVENGYIVYVASSEDKLIDNAHSKAESQALSDLANECSLVPKGARIEDRYDRIDGRLHQSFAKVAVEFQLCEEAKRAIDPSDIKRIASAPFTEQIKRYQDLVAEQNEAMDLDDSNTTGTLNSPSANPQLRWVTVRSEPEFWVIRQQIAFQKQIVVLSPPTAYPPQAYQTQQVTAQLSGASQEVQKFVASHPATAHPTYSSWSQFQRAQKIDRKPAYLASQTHFQKREKRKGQRRRRHSRY